MFIAFATYKNSDMTEGRGPMVLDKVYVNEEDAQNYILQQLGVMGRKPEPGYGWTRMGDWVVKPLYILESLEDGPELERRIAIKSGMAKLNASERKALGLSEDLLSN
jgi:hypothetical protein